ncbi:Serine/threonine-protein phosphatase 1 [subsurface metagenome]
MINDICIDENDYKRIIVIGDLHGYDEPLIRLIQEIQMRDDDLVIFIGDYIDRGPASKPLIDNLIQLKSSNKNTIFLKGNHEDMMLGSMGFPAVIKDINTWMYNGGSSTLYSYGVQRKEMFNLINVWDDNERFQFLKDLIPKSHIDFLLDLRLFIESDHYFFCHAGISPYSNVADGKRNAFDLLWMRDHIYAQELNWGKIVVCGHTPLHEVLITDQLICVDTGLFYYGKLSAINVMTEQIYQVQRIY